MQNKSYISTLEQKLLIGFFLIISLLFYFHLAVKKIENYNRNVELEQIEKTSQANKIKDKVSFAIFVNEKIYLTTDFFWINFLLIPLIFFALKKREFSQFIFSALINFLTTSSLVFWNIDNYLSHLMNTTYYLSRSDYGYFGVISNTTALILAIAATIFVIIQLAIITRFVFEKNQAKISSI